MRVSASRRWLGMITELTSSDSSGYGQKHLEHS